MKKFNKVLLGTGIGLLLGSIIGYLSNSLEVWIPVGISCGVLFGLCLWGVSKRNNYRE